jgi:hypothetical protein
MSAGFEQASFLYGRGRQSGPFSELKLREMLNREEISLAHQVGNEGRQVRLSARLQRTHGGSAVHSIDFANARKFEARTPDSELVKQRQSWVNVLSHGLGPAKQASSCGIPVLDAAPPAPEPFAKKPGACLDWKCGLAANAGQAEEMAATLSKYTVKLSHNPESYDH